MRKYKMVFEKTSEKLGNYDGAEPNDYLINIPYSYKRHGQDGCLLFIDRLECELRERKDSPLVPIRPFKRHIAEGYGTMKGLYFFTFEREQKDIPKCMAFVQQCADNVLY